MPEVMVASGVITLSLLGIGMLQGMVLRMNHLTDSMVEATAACQAKIEEITAQDAGARASGTDSWGGYARSWTLTGGISPGTEALAVTSNWRDMGGSAHQMSLSTILAD